MLADRIELGTLPPPEVPIGIVPSLDATMIPKPPLARQRQRRLAGLEATLTR
jgi:hypothetical protein